MPTFQAAPKPTEENIEIIVERARKRKLRYLEKRCAIITVAIAPGEGEVKAVLEEGFG